MSSANDKQIGGSHYKKKKKITYQHWDLIVFTRSNYLEVNITKYVSRWRNKNGVLDLEKAKHYAEKLLEVYRAFGYINDSDFVLNGYRRTKANMILQTFLDEHQMGPTEDLIFSHVLAWSDEGNIMAATALIQGLIDGASK